MTNILELLESAAEKYGGKTVFFDDDTRLSFDSLLKKAKSIGSFLLSNGITKRPVVVFMEKKPDTIAAFMGVLYAGCYYVPADGETPKNRLEHIFKKLEDACAVTCGGKKTLNENGFSGCIYDFEEAAAFPADTDALTEVRNAAVDTDPAYIVFTSGSTGEPKGVIACHRSVLDYAEAIAETLGADENTVFGMQAPLYVDACLKELLCAFKRGSSVYMIKRQLFMFPVKLVESLNKHRVNTVCWVASALSLISSLGTFKTCVPEYLKTIAFGSEVFAPKQLEIWRKYLPGARYINLYGPTEATGMSCFYELPGDRVFDERTPVPIGRPFKNTRVMLIDENGREAGEGEICILGTALALGYYKDGEKTKEAFCQNPLNSLYPERMYRTGDIGRYDKNGDLVFVSRKDGQIKHMGHRIELGEIEAAAASFNGVALACCVYDGEKKRITLFFSGGADVPELAAHLKSALSPFMLPQSIKNIKSMPLTSNGKIDRTRLKELAKE